MIRQQKIVGRSGIYPVCLRAVSVGDFSASPLACLGFWRFGYLEWLLSPRDDGPRYAFHRA